MGFVVFSVRKSIYDGHLRAGPVHDIKTHSAAAKTRSCNQNIWSDGNTVTESDSILYTRRNHKHQNLPFISEKPYPQKFASPMPAKTTTKLAPSRPCFN